MKRSLHPLTILVAAAFPFVLYSTWRTGYQVTHLFDVRLFSTRYIWEALLLTSVVLACCVCYRRDARKILSFVALAAIGAFLAFQSAEEYPADYKLWVYVVAPIFAWSITFSSAIMVMMRQKKPNPSSQPMLASGPLG